MLTATSAPAGSPEKVEVLRLRAALRWPLWHPGDSQELAPPSKNSFGFGQLAGLILATLREQGGLPLPELAEALHAAGNRANLLTLHSTVMRLVRQGKVIRGGKRRRRVYHAALGMAEAVRNATGPRSTRAARH